MYVYTDVSFYRCTDVCLNTCETATAFDENMHRCLNVQMYTGVDALQMYKCIDVDMHLCTLYIYILHALLVTLLHLPLIHYFLLVLFLFLFLSFISLPLSFSYVPVLCLFLVHVIVLVLSVFHIQSIKALQLHSENFIRRVFATRFILRF